MLGAAFLLVSLAAAPQEDYELPEGLVLTPLGLSEVEHRPYSQSQLKGTWKAVVGEVQLELAFYVLDAERFRFVEPDDVTGFMARNRERDSEGRSRFRFESTEALAGEHFGYVPYASLGRAPIKEETRVTGTFFCLGGLTPSVGWALAVECRPPPAGADLAAIERFLAEGLSAAPVEARVFEWTDEEARTRWRKDVPEDLTEELDKIVRTDHYLILTNSGGGRKFGEKMEECYEEIQDVYPFPEVASRRLMPVFLFRTRDQYARFMSKVTGISVEEALRSAGHAMGDYYATTYEAPGDPVHIHEATHQIFGNRLRLDGGGSWFQEGVAEYIETSDRTRKNWARKAVKKGTYKPLSELFVLESMLYSAGTENVKGGSEAGDNYTQAASIIEFARDGKWHPERFQDFLHTVGSVSRSDLAAIEAALYSVYEVGIDEFEAQWVAYWKKK